MADELAHHLDTHGLSNPWSPAAGANTRALYASALGADAEVYEPRRAVLHQTLASDAYRSRSASIGGVLTLVLTAGPPGAGKSRVIQQDTRWRGFRQLDADDFKDALLDHAQRDGLLTGLLQRDLADGRPVHLRELSAFVHAESLAVFEVLRDRCIDANENIVMHGTLNDVGAVTEVLRRIAEGGGRYDRIEIAHVPVPLELAVEGAMERWWRERTGFLDGRGGRFVSPDSFDRYFLPDHSPHSEQLVQQVEALATGFGFEVSVRRFERR